MEFRVINPENLAKKLAFYYVNAWKQLSTLKGLIFTLTYFRETKKIVFCEDLISRISYFQNFCEDLISRINIFSIFRKDLFSRVKFVQINFKFDFYKMKQKQP